MMFALLFSLACALIIPAHVADFLLQADQHGWILFTYRDGRDKFGAENKGRKKPFLGHWQFREWIEEPSKPSPFVQFSICSEYRWYLNKSAKKWPWYVDWVPRDEWHWLQWTRNMGWLFSAVLTVYTLPALGAWSIAAAWALWVIGRGVGYSVPMHFSPNVTRA